MASSQATPASAPSISDQPITGTSLDFFLFFKATYPDEDTQNVTGGSRKRKSRGMVMYRCLHCPADKPWANRKRDNAWHHARRCHADIISCIDRTLIEGSSEVLDDEREAKRPRIDAFFPSRYSDVSLRRIFDRDRYLDAIISLITRRRLAFSAIAWDEMQEIMLAANPAIEDLLVTNRSALMRLIDATYELYSSQLMATLETAVSKIHISSDLWASPHRHGILAISARWVDENYQPRRALLSMPECRYSHGGETQASLIIDTLAKYGIASKVGYHVGDNASSNDTCLSYLSHRLREDYGLSFDPVKGRIRCVAHTINISLQAFLLASSKEALIAALNAVDDTSNDQLFAHAVRILVGLLHNGEIDVALFHRQRLAGEPLNLKPLIGVVFVAYPGVRFLKPGSITNLLDNAFNFVSDKLIIFTVSAAKLVHLDVGSFEPQTSSVALQTCRVLQLVAVSTVADPTAGDQTGGAGELRDAETIDAGGEADREGNGDQPDAKGCRETND
ncbi:restless-like transposase [Metarhizium robertsii ARSEF 23]|uniref:Restless-like transposase n=1 Tax=Metarhizium robertsii (strain ARSEF 23 / ATCC MYA-3075) TaxID=655844 RepID=E9FD04_METRA|nr:restless-like transposase [Metarhizium robertsii ARSEF 23]EFY94382.1 restless-like transposase [Metarhizium robertsii ARSEF 23]